MIYNYGICSNNKMKNICKGINSKKERCNKVALKGERFCTQHLEKYKDYTYEELEKLYDSKCRGIVRDGSKCIRIKINGTDFCKWHQYMNDYTDEMLQNLTSCGTCKKMYYLVDYKTCEKCRGVCSKNRKKARENVIKCKKESCSFKRSKENEYCGQHQIDHFLEQVKKRGKKPCKNYNRKCRVELDLDYKYYKCSDCLEKDRKKDNEKYHHFHIQKVLVDILKC
jgi:hypothetical protein